MFDLVPSSHTCSCTTAPFVCLLFFVVRLARVAPGCSRHRASRARAPQPCQRRQALFISGRRRSVSTLVAREARPWRIAQSRAHTRSCSLTAPRLASEPEHQPAWRPGAPRSGRGRGREACRPPFSARRHERCGSVWPSQESEEMHRAHEWVYALASASRRGGGSLP